MHKKLAALRRNKTFNLVGRPQERKIIGSKWVYKIKRLADGFVERLKARGVAKGYSQTPCQDYDKIFAPVVRYESLQLLLAICTHNGRKPQQLNVKSAFLYRELSEEAYRDPLPRYEQDGMV